MEKKQKCRFCNRKAEAFVSSTQNPIGWVCAKHYVEKVDLECILAMPENCLSEKIKKEVKRKYGIII